jgi:hypothetical protein
MRVQMREYFYKIQFYLLLFLFFLTNNGIINLNNYMNIE